MLDGQTDELVNFNDVYVSKIEAKDYDAPIGRTLTTSEMMMNSLVRYPLTELYFYSYLY